MNRLFSIAAVVFVLATPVWAQTDQERIKDAVSPLPESLRAGATVVTYDDGVTRKVLRVGGNSVVCVADSPAPGFAVACFHSTLERFYVRVMELAMEGRSPEETEKLVIDELREGKLPTPEPGATRYFRAGATRDGALPIMAVEIPFATEESTGLSTEPSSYRPWLMHPGTPQAHIMIPGK